MGKKSKKRVTLRILLIFFIILAFTGIGLLLQTYIRQTGEQKKNEQTAEKLQKDISGLEETVKTLTAEQTRKAEAEAEKAQNSETETSGDASGGTEGLTDLKTEIQNKLADRDGTWSVYVKNLNTQEYLDYNNQPLKAASLIKLYIMGAVYDGIQNGNLEMTESVESLLNNMITVSDNESANELVRMMSGTGEDFQEGMQVVNDFADKNGYTDTSQGRDLQDVRTVPAGGENYTSVKDCGSFLEKIYNKTNVSESASDDMLELLKLQERRNKIPAGLPEGVVCANKTGELDSSENDAALVFCENGTVYVFCVISQDLTDSEGARTAIQELSTVVYQYFNGQ